MRKRLAVPCICCGSHHTWGCGWCTPGVEEPAFDTFVWRREDDNAFVTRRNRDDKTQAPL